MWKFQQLVGRKAFLMVVKVDCYVILLEKLAKRTVMIGFDRMGTVRVLRCCMSVVTTTGRMTARSVVTVKCKPEKRAG